MTPATRSAGTRPGRLRRSGRAVDIVGCGVLTATGSGLAPVAAALRSEPDRHPDGVGVAPAGWPPLSALPVDGFDPAALLGRKGLSRATRTDQLAMAACQLALDDAGPGPRPEETGIVLGTAVGSASALMDFFRDTFEQKRPYLVNPSHFPGTLMNSAASKTAIRQGLTGLNATLSGGSLAAMHALRYARTTMLAGRARRVLAGGVEELSQLTAWAWQQTGALAAGVPLAEGCAMFALDAPGDAGQVTDTRVLGRLLACEIGFADPAAGVPAVAARLTDAITTALARSGVTEPDVTVVVPGTGGRRGWAAVEERVLRGVLPAGPHRRRIPVHRVLGEVHGAGTAIGLAALMADWRYPPPDAPAADRVAVLTSVGFNGSVGAAVVAHPRFIH